MYICIYTNYIYIYIYIRLFKAIKRMLFTIAKIRASNLSIKILYCASVRMCFHVNVQMKVKVGNISIFDLSPLLQTLHLQNIYRKDIR